MGKTVPFQVTWNSEASYYQLNDHTQDNTASIILTAEDDFWEHWLNQVSSFAFHGRNGEHFTARKEQRKRGGGYWTAYRKINGKLRRKYLGASRDLVLELLEETASTLAAQELPYINSASLSQPPLALSSPNSLAPLSQYWQEPLLATKFLVPGTRRTLIRRSRLEALLTDGIQQPVTLISAPAGFGKTSLVEGWLRGVQPQNTRVAWVSLDEADNNILRFWTYVLTALDKSEPGVGQQALALLQDRQAPALDYIATILINALSQRVDPFVLVLDDYQVIDEPTIHSSFDFLIEHQPLQLRIILLTRGDPPLKLSRLRARGMVQEIRSDHLRCTIEEASQFLDEVMNIRFPVEVLSRVMERTEGWLVGLQLLGLSVRGNDDPAQFLSTVTGTERFILDYLTEEVLRQQPNTIQEFLLYTSILDPLSGSLCDAVMHQSNSQIILDQLERTNLFVSPLDRQHQWYRYHALFAESLRYHLERTHAPFLPVLHRRASLWYAGHNQISEAVEHALHARDWELASDLIDSSAWTLLSSKGQTLWNWLQQIPSSVVQTRPRLCQLNVSLINRVGPIRDALPWLQALEESLKDTSLQSRTEPDFPARQRRQAGQIAAFRALVNGYYGNETETDALCRQATVNLGEDDFFEHAVVATAQAMVAEGTGQAITAAQRYMEASRLHQDTGNLADAVLNMASAAAALHLQSKLHDAWHTCERAIEMVTPYGDPPSALACFAYARQANLLREWNRLDEAFEVVNESINLGMQIGYPLALLAGYEVLVLIQFSRADLDGAEAALQQLAALPCITDNMCLRAWWFTNSQVRLWICQGQKERAAQWAARLIEAKRLPSQYACEREDVARVRVLLMLGQPDKALKLLDPLRSGATLAGRFDHVIEMYILEAHAYSLCGEEKDALSSLDQALRLAESGGYIRSFVDEGPVIADLLGRLYGEQPHRNPTPYLAKLLTAFPKENSGEQRTSQQLLTDSLSDREQEVLQELARGASNQEIADRLVLSVETVKRHLYNIFLKLDVNNRTQAVIRAQALGILLEEK